MAVSPPGFAQGMRGAQTNTRNLPQGVNPSLFDLNHSLYDWKIKDNPYTEPCYYNETYGQWVGPCNTLDSPGFSITTPNTISHPVQRR
jgi:hypothetical protein